MEARRWGDPPTDLTDAFWDFARTGLAEAAGFWQKQDSSAVIARLRDYAGDHEDDDAILWLDEVENAGSEGH